MIVKQYPPNDSQPTNSFVGFGHNSFVGFVHDSFVGLGLYTCLALVLIIASSSFVLSQSEYLPLDQSLNFKIGNTINSTSSQVHTALQPYELSRLGMAMSYDSVLRYHRWEVNDSASWVCRKIFYEPPRLGSKKIR